jgi:capsule polysaccharide export protein KpsE/RkpR
MTAGILKARLVTAGATEGPREETSLLAFLSIILAHRRVVAIASFAGLLIFGLIAASEATLYESRASYVVKGARAPLQLPGGAAALGISLAAYSEFSQSVVFYSDLAASKSILRTIAGEMYETVDSKGQKRRLADVYGIKERDKNLAEGLAADQLKPFVSSNISTRSGVVRLSVKQSDPLLAQQIAANILVEIDKWSKDRSHAQAIREREFLEALVADEKVKTTQAEQALSNFLAVNREFISAPLLDMEHDRLTREVQMRQQIYTSLAQTLEQARIEEVRAPVLINIVETADLPVEPMNREALRTTLLGLVGGMLVGIVIALIQQRALEKTLRTSD